MPHDHPADRRYKPAAKKPTPRFGPFGKPATKDIPIEPVAESSGLDVDYYLCPVANPNRAAKPYVAECGDIIEGLNMTFNEATVFKSVWRKAAERTLGRKKAGNTAVRDAEKMVFYSKRELSVMTGKKVK